MKINRTRDSLEVEANGRSFRLDPERPFQVQVKEHLSVRYDMGQWLPPKAFKDWNDCLLNKPMEVRLHPTKQDKSITWPNAEMQALNYKRMNVRRWKRSLLIAAVGLLIGKTPLFAQQTDGADFCRTGADRSLEEDSQGPQENAGENHCGGSGRNRFLGADSPGGRQDAGLPLECAGRHAEPLPD